MISRSEALMGTVVTIRVLRPSAEEAVERAFGWFREIEAHCTRFDPASELSRLTTRVGVPVASSPILFQAVQFALKVAAETGGAFDPTVGRKMEQRGFNREHRTGAVVDTPIDQDEVTYRDIVLDTERNTITLRRPLLLDLGAVAKGLAVDAAARELAPLSDFSIDAGGDLYLGGLNPKGDKWSVGIRHPRRDGELIDTVRVSNQAVCTSGDYERADHILDPRTVTPATAVASATVIAPSAMLADALATAAFVLGPAAGIQLLNRMGVEGLIVTPSLQRFETGGLRHAA